MARILVITPSYDPRLGGVEKHVWHTSQLLAAKGHRITILTQRFSGLPKFEQKKELSIHRFDYPRIRFFGLLMIWWTLFRNYARLIREAELVHIHDVFIWYLPLRFLYLFKPVVTTFHGWEGKYPVPFKNILFRQFGTLFSHRTIAIGKYLEKYYRFKADKIIYGGVDVPRGNFKKENLLLYIGRLDYDTGLPVLLQALQTSVWPGKVVFCGDGLLREQAEMVGEVKGFVDARPYLKKAKVVFAGGYLSILEAFAYRCAVIAAQKNPLKKDYYLLSPFAAWLTVVNTPEDLNRHLSVITKQSAQVKYAVEQAFKWVKTQTWQAVVKEYEQIYNDIYAKNAG